ncbi:prolipoprotein diacylglyceryl transferase [Mesomycoplasma lagogenitalium]|uniref:Prolipoprotein diacylglyceryl transferase n=1 Tax=Mesomycoplasma lagogenitalium TaxID=171286 RepID=A0ABY8LUE9_9BACT|nr:prolipoprotein diacylglyceryl transferase [Mesomycoplasma lagogenitalium]WGI36859.1 prolipoprotein diacylglyceryl transferase [Mesomycoplasma lagogenitalium]
MNNQELIEKFGRPFSVGEAYEIFPGFPVYSFMIFLGMVFAILTIAFFWKRENLNFDHLFVLIIITIPSSIIGARLGFIFEQISVGNGGSLKDNWWNIRSGGLSIQWGVILSASLDLVYVFIKRKELDYRKCLSIILPTVLIGQAVGRWGNFTNHEVYGKQDLTGEWTLWLGPIISKNMFISDAVYPNGALRIPLFFYEFLTSLIGYIIIVWILNFFNWLKPGVTAGFYLIWYGIVRSSMEFLREESYVIYFVLAIFYIIFGIALSVYYQFFGNYVYKIVDKKLKIEKRERYKAEKKPIGKAYWIFYERINYEIQEQQTDAQKQLKLEKNTNKM